MKISGWSTKEGSVEKDCPVTKQRRCRVVLVLEDSFTEAQTEHLKHIKGKVPNTQTIIQPDKFL